MCILLWLQDLVNCFAAPASASANHPSQTAKGNPGFDAMRIDTVRVFLGTIDGLLYFVLNSSARCPRGDEDELPFTEADLGHHVHRGLEEG